MARNQAPKMKTLNDTAEWKLGQAMAQGETIEWVCGPEHLAPAQKKVMVILMILILSVTAGNMMIDDGLPLIAKLSFLLPMLMICGAIFWLSNRNNGLARYVITNRQVIVITPKFLGYDNAMMVRYPLGPKSIVDIETDLTGSNIGQLTIKSPDHYKNPEKRTQQMILNAVSNPASLKSKIEQTISRIKAQMN